MTTAVTKESLVARIAELESGARSLKEDYTLAAYNMLLATMEDEPVAWEYEWASYITCGGPQDFEHIIELEAPPEWAIEKGLARNVIPLYRHAPPAPLLSDELKEAAADFLTVLDEYPEQLVPINRDSAVVRALRAAMLADSPQPTPVVPEEMTPQQASRSYGGEVRGYRAGWNACRAAMINQK